jgi:hypothetical protein
LKLKVGGYASPIKLYVTLNCWVKNVETYNTGAPQGEAHIRIQFSHQCEIRDSYVHHGQSNDSGANYGIDIEMWNSDHKIENNVIRDTRHSIVFNGGGSGCAVLYNYTNDNWESNFGMPATPVGGLTPDLTVNHGAHPHMNLFEGNYSTNLQADDYHGSSSHNTLFRNYVSVTRSTPAVTWARWGFDIGRLNRYYNIVGNVIGNPDWTSGTVLANGNCSPKEPAAYRFGCGIGTPGSYLDSQSYSTSIIHGNYDYITGGVAHWGGGTDHHLPSSMYYASKPEFFGTNPWPPFGYDMDPIIGSLPAKERHEGKSIIPTKIQSPPLKLTIM